VFFARQGVAAAVLARLRRGQYRVETQIDLHGLTATQAREALREFLQAMQREQARCVRVIHGKGRRSGHLGPVLKPAVQAMLQKIDAVLAYASARPADGGTGALYVLLR
jgi:DNA-nicking Smr family endonuclease